MNFWRFVELIALKLNWNNEDSFLNDARQDLKAGYVIANSPFNDKLLKA